MNISLTTLSFILVLGFSINACTGDSTTRKTELKQDVKTPTRIFEPLDAIAFLNKMNDKNVVVLDVRSAFQIKKGKIENAIEISILSDDFNAKVRKLDKTKTYLIYSRTGRTGVRACRRMSDMNFRYLYNLDGGHEAFQRVISHKKENEE